MYAARFHLLAVAFLALAGCGRESTEGRAIESAGISSGPGATAAVATGGVESLLLITIDTLRADAVGFMGNDVVATPLLDELAAAGRVFENAHAHNVVTLPSHVNILTGLHPFQHGVRDNGGFVLGSELPTASTLLRQAGFATAAAVAAFPLDSRYGLARGFDLYDDRLPEGSAAARIGMAERPGGEVVAVALRWWRENEGRRRFLWIHLFEPHAPYEPPEPYATRHPGQPYLGEVETVDALLEPLLRPLLDGLEASTLLVLTSDHGEGLGEHGERTHGLFAYESTLHVPLVVWGDGVPVGREAGPARHIDVLPTLLDAAAVEAPDGLPGRSLLRPLSAEARRASETYFEALTANLSHGWAPLRGLIRGRWKMIDLPLPELYDLTADPEEEANLAAEERRAFRELRAGLPAESSWPPERGDVSAEEAERLRSLGYLGGGGGRKAEYRPADDPKRLVELDARMHEVIALLQRGQPERAAAAAREVIRRRDDMGVAHYYLAQALLEAGRPADALEAMGGAYARGVATPALTRQLGLSLAGAGRFAEALEVLRPLAATEDPDALNALGVVLSESGDQAAAHQALESVFELDRRNPAAARNLALVALRQERWEEAERWARRAVGEDEELALAWSYLGTALHRQGDGLEALDAWERAVELEPDNLDALFNIAVSAPDLGEYRRARRALERFIARAPAERYARDIEAARQMLQALPR